MRTQQIGGKEQFAPPGSKSVDGMRFQMHVPENQQDLNRRIFCALKKMSNTTEKTVGEIASEWKSIQEIMDYAATHVKQSWADTKDEAPKWLQDIRGIRMALSSEVKMIQQSIRDMEEATTGEVALKRIAAVTSLVELCERLRAVQNDGTFEKVLNALLKA